MNDGNRAIKRVDPEVRFDYKTDSPDLATIKPKEYAARWQGSVFAPETGEYEFIDPRTPNSAPKCSGSSDNRREALIDAWVQSEQGPRAPRRRSRLLGGRAYPIRLEFAKGKDGVKDKKDPEGEEEVIDPAAIALEWKGPGRSVETIPARDLSPSRMPEAFVLETPFPPDDRSIGYERGTSVSKAWDAATTEAAIETADYVSRPPAATSRALRRRRRPREEAPASSRRSSPSRPSAGRAGRRGEEGLRSTSNSPRASSRGGGQAGRAAHRSTDRREFLYREVGGSSDAYAVASRISFGLWDSSPDAALLDALPEWETRPPRTASRSPSRPSEMLKDVRARAKLRDFFFQWLKVDQSPDLAKDGKLFPGFDASVASDLRTSLDLFLEDVAWGESSDFRQLLLSDSAYLNGRLAKLYGVDLPADAPFRKVAFAKDRAGVITHPYLLATFAYTSSSSPIHRGVFLARSVLGKTLRPPPRRPWPRFPGRPPRRDDHHASAWRCRPEPRRVPDLPRDGQPARLHIGGLRRHRPIPQGRRRQAGRRLEVVHQYPLRGARSPPSTALAVPRRVPRRHRGGPRRLRREALPPSRPAADPRSAGPDHRAGFAARSAKHDFQIRDLMVEISSPRRPSAPTLASPPRASSRPLRGPPSRPHRTAPASARSPPKSKSPSPTRRNNRGHHTFAALEFLRDLGIGATTLPFLLNLPSRGLRQPPGGSQKKRLVVMFSPDGVVPDELLPRRGRGQVHAQGRSLKPLERRFKDIAGC